MTTAHSNKHHKSQDAFAGAAVGRLSVVATPIGNLGDMTLRALEVLKSADVIACEDTRTTAVLLSHFGITTRMMAYHQHNEAAATTQLLARMQQGDHVALVSDAGTPLLSDPGARLVRAAIDAGLAVSPLPGASALLAALCMAGLPSDTFYFAGFLPQKNKAQQAQLAMLAPLPATLVFYEAPHRLLATLARLQAALGDRRAVVARELTKRFEECQRGMLSQIIAHYTATPPRGECVIVVDGAAAQAAMDDAAIDAALRDALARLSLKQAVDEVASMAGQPRRSVYQRALALAKS